MPSPRNLAITILRQAVRILPSCHASSNRPHRRRGAEDGHWGLTREKIAEDFGAAETSVDPDPPKSPSSPNPPRKWDAWGA